jgi:hypothetical protein
MKRREFTAPSIKAAGGVGLVEGMIGYCRVESCRLRRAAGPLSGATLKTFAQSEFFSV